MQLPLAEIAALVGSSGRPGKRVARGYSIDSRTLQEGDLFFAIKGPRLDGHDYVAQAFERGAAGAVVAGARAAGYAPELGPALIPVSDPAEALQTVARAVRQKWGRRVVAVTGSTGKSTTKEMIAALLARRFAVHKSPGNLNNQYGVPLALLGLEPAHEVAVFELAMSAPGEIAQLARLSGPQVGVVTNVAPVHLQFFESLEAIARAKRELVENLQQPATAVLNADDPRVKKFAEGFGGAVVTYGFGEGARVRAATLARHRLGHRFRVEGPAVEGTYRLRLPGRHNVSNALAAIATASVFGLSYQEMAETLGQFEGLAQRSEILTLPGKVTVLNDCYNSNPLAMERLLETIAEWPRARRRIVVAGEMLELGPGSPELHRLVGKKCAGSGVDWLLAVQGDARFMLEGAQEAGLAPDRLKFYPSAAEAGEAVRAILAPGDVVLVKGSRGVHLERVIELLRSH